MANWFYTMSGGVSSVQVVTGGNIPTIPGSIKSDYDSLGISTPYYLKDIIKQLWNKDAVDINYTSLPKLSDNGKYQIGYWWNGRWNNSVGHVTHTFEFDVPNSTKFYLGGAPFFNGCATHKVRDYYSSALMMSAEVTYIDDTKETFTLNSPYISKTHDIGPWTILHQIGKIFTTPKAFKHIHVTSSFKNAGAEWHDVGDRGPNDSWYRNKCIEVKAGSCLNNIFGIDYTSLFNLPYWNGGVSGYNVVEDPKTTTPKKLYYNFLVFIKHIYHLLGGDK